jgi:hypothetical protein
MMAVPQMREADVAVYESLAPSLRRSFAESELRQKKCFGKDSEISKIRIDK